MHICSCQALVTTGQDLCKMYLFSSLVRSWQWCTLAGILFVPLSCNKAYTITPDPLATNIIALTGSEGAYSKWRLNKIAIEQVTQPANTINKDYYKSYQLNGSFEDGDGLRGKWSLVAKDSLREIVTNTQSGAYAIQQFHINKLTRTELSLSYFVNAKEVSISFTAER